MLRMDLPVIIGRQLPKHQYQEIFGGLHLLGADDKTWWNSKEATAAPAECPVKRISFTSLFVVHFSNRSTTSRAKALAAIRKPA